VAPRARFELEPYCGRERKREPAGETLRESAPADESKGLRERRWLPGLDSNLSRIAGVSASGSPQAKP